MRISHEAIYQALYIAGRGGLARDATACLRTEQALRVPRARTRGRGKKFVNPNILIDKRPTEADDRKTAGHWEGDLVRHEALYDRAEVRDLRRCAVAAA